MSPSLSVEAGVDSTRKGPYKVSPYVGETFSPAAGGDRGGGAVLGRGDLLLALLPEAAQRAGAGRSRAPGPQRRPARGDQRGAHDAAGARRAGERGGAR